MNIEMIRSRANKNSELPGKLAAWRGEIEILQWGQSGIRNADDHCKNATQFNPGASVVRLLASTLLKEA